MMVLQRHSGSLSVPIVMVQLSFQVFLSLGLAIQYHLGAEFFLLKDCSFQLPSVIISSRHVFSSLDIIFPSLICLHSKHERHQPCK